MTEARKKNNPVRSKDPKIDARVVIQEPMIGKLSVVFYFAFAVACLRLFISFSGEKTVAWLMYPFGFVFAILFGLDGLQRRVVFQRHQVCVRHIWIWKRIPLPVNVRIQEGRHGEIEFVSPEGNRVLFRLGREYDPINKYLELLKKFFSQSAD